MAANSLLFIPDISGFTRFVHQTEVQHSQHITAELLEILIDANELQMTLAEIEGDALFFYKEGDVPSNEALLQQVQNMYLKFHQHLQLYEQRRICQCGACCMAATLELKFVAHVGAFNFIQIKEHRKPYGVSIIEVHRLLKNNVPIEEYVLLSKDLVNEWKTDISLPSGWVKPSTSQSEYGEIGKIDYDYLPLSHLKSQIELPVLEESLKVNTPIRLKTQINLSIQETYELLSNFEYRLAWNENVNELKYEKNQINRVGTRHHCVVDKNLIAFETVTADFGSQRIVYGEKIISKIPGIKKLVNYFILESNEKGTKLCIELHYKIIPVIGHLILPILKRKMKQNLQKALYSFKAFAESTKQLELV